MRILIPGGDGFVGNSFREYYHGEHEIIYGTRRQKPYEKNTVFLDVTDRLCVEKVVQSVKPNVIINLSAINSITAANENPKHAILVNVDGSRNILEAVKNSANNTKTILISSSEVYKNSNNPLTEESPTGPRNIYGESKLRQEEICDEYNEKYGLNIINVRAFNHAGIFQKENTMIASFCNQVARIDAGIDDNNVIWCGNLNVNRDISDVRDVIEAYILLAENTEIKSGTYNVCRGVATSIREILNIITGFSKKEICIKTDPQRVRIGEPRLILGDCSKLHKDIGFESRYKIESTLRLMYDYYRGKLDEKV